ncbi:hypothetical protein GcM1_244047 [Golovinomyces cichoracearum]|uniref:Uncharacterized protein n=1 Tax=Golovinomyces cichoracearum TaxID=62708 RepID=A0A420IFP7_9PEZI|nr:hypothetical protein GcM1_244047 [Golovinomyces cichoracearum]
MVLVKCKMRISPTVNVGIMVTSIRGSATKESRKVSKRPYQCVSFRQHISTSFGSQLDGDKTANIDEEF